MIIWQSDNVGEVELILVYIGTCKRCTWLRFAVDRRGSLERWCWTARDLSIRLGRFEGYILVG